MITLTEKEKDLIRYGLYKIEEEDYSSSEDRVLASELRDRFNTESTDEIYFIRNTVNEQGTAISGYYKTLEEAKEALGECSDWYRDKGTGRIYKVKFGTLEKPELVCEK